MLVLYIDPRCRPRPPIVVAATMIALMQLAGHGPVGAIDHLMTIIIECAVGRSIHLRPEAWS